MKNLRPLDDVDRAILRLIAVDARISNASLAEKVGIAPSTAHTRLRALRESGVIRSLRAEIDPAAVGRGLQAMIAVRVHAGARAQLQQTAQRLAACVEVLDIFFLAGPQDFLVHVAVSDTAALRAFVVDQLSAHREVAHTETSLVFEHMQAAGSSAP